jgi:hypothetical protein
MEDTFKAKVSETGGKDFTKNNKDRKLIQIPHGADTHRAGAATRVGAAKS